MKAIRIFDNSLISYGFAVLLMPITLTCNSALAEEQGRDRLIAAIQMPVAVTKLIQAGMPSEELQRIAGALNRGKIEPRYFNETIRRVPAMANRLESLAGVADFVVNKVKAGVKGEELAQSIHGKLLSLEIPPGAFRGTAPSPLDREFVSEESKRIIKKLARTATFEQQPAVRREPSGSSSGLNVGPQGNLSGQSSPRLRNQSGGPVGR